MNQKLARLVPYVLPCLFVGFLALTFFAPAVHAQGGDLTPASLKRLKIGLFTGANPLEVIVNIINFMLLVGGIIAFLFALYGGFLYLTAGGDAARAGTGRTVIVNAVIGIIIIFLSYAIILFFVRFTNRTDPNAIFETTGSGSGPLDTTNP
jgi:hypothetical protein